MDMDGVLVREEHAITGTVDTDVVMRIPCSAPARSSALLTACGDDDERSARGLRARLDTSNGTSAGSARRLHRGVIRVNGSPAREDPTHQASIGEDTPMLTNYGSPKTSATPNPRAQRSRLSGIGASCTGDWWALDQLGIPPQRAVRGVGSDSQRVRTGTPRPTARSERGLRVSGVPDPSLRSRRTAARPCRRSGRQHDSRCGDKGRAHRCASSGGRPRRSGQGAARSQNGLGHLRGHRLRREPDLLAQQRGLAVGHVAVG